MVRDQSRSYKLFVLEFMMQATLIDRTLPSSLQNFFHRLTTSALEEKGTKMDITFLTINSYRASPASAGNFVSELNSDLFGFALTA